jgi:hypothetical protein
MTRDATIFAPLTVEDVMDLLPGLSARAVKEVLRQHGCASEIRGKLFVSIEQFKRLLEETQICPKSSGVGATVSSSHAKLPLASLAYERALELATQKSRKIGAPRRNRALPRRHLPAASKE